MISLIAAAAVVAFLPEANRIDLLMVAAVAYMATSLTVSTVKELMGRA